MLSRPSSSASSSLSGSSGAGQPAARNSPSCASSSSRSAAATIWCTREDESLTAAASARMDTPSARADASAQLRSRSACSSRHAARDTRSSTRRSRRHAAIRSAIFMHTACPACTVQQSGHAGGVHGVVLTDTPARRGHHDSTNANAEAARARLGESYCEEQASDGPVHIEGGSGSALRVCPYDDRPTNTPPTGTIPSRPVVSRIERYPDTAARPGAAPRPAGHDVGKPCRENYAA